MADTEAVFRRLKRWFTEDHDTQSAWRRKAREDFAFTAGGAAREDDKARLREMNRPIIVMNRIEPVIDSVAGSEVANRQEVRFIPRSQGDVQVNEVLTAAAKWFRDQCDAEDEESDAFRDTIICGMGWTETRLDYEDEPEGAPRIERCDPLQMVWDSAATKRNLADMRRVFHIRRDIPIAEARAPVPGRPVRGRGLQCELGRRGYRDRAASCRQQILRQGRAQCRRRAGSPRHHGRAQWWERVPVYLVLDPTNPDNILTLDKQAFDDLAAKAKLAGVELSQHPADAKDLQASVPWQCAAGDRRSAMPRPFSLGCITEKRDRNANSWYGLVRAMKDPQRWANKWMSQTMHIMNTSAKGGILAERGFLRERRGCGGHLGAAGCDYLGPARRALGAITEVRAEAAVGVSVLLLPADAVRDLLDPRRLRRQCRDPGHGRPAPARPPAWTCSANNRR